MRKLLWFAAAALATGCASPFHGYGVEPGTPRDAVLARLGPPTGVVRLDGGERLQYSLQPFGQYAWMIDLDPAGKVVRARQVLTANEFNRIQPGAWTGADVEREFGRPARVDRVTSWNGPIMTYRWKDRDNSDMFYFVYLDEQGVVGRAHPGMEFINTPRDRE